MRRGGVVASVASVTWLALALVAFSALAGCSATGRKGMANAKATSDVRPSDYLDSLERWTVTKKVYHDLETRLIVSATYHSGAFRSDYVDEYARRYLLDTSEREEMLRKSLKEAERFHEFVFAAYTPESRWNDFSRRQSSWRLRLYDDQGNAVEPLVVTKPKQDDPLLRAFYPYFTLWSRFYVVKFPREGLSPETKTLKLQMTSALGAAEMTYPRGEDLAAPIRVENTPGNPVPTAAASPSD